MRTTGLVIIIAAAVAALCGCQAKNGGSATAGGADSADTALVRRAQVVAAENLELKKIIALKDAEIAELKSQLDDAQAENQRIMEQHAEIYGGLMRHLLECSQKLEAYEKTETIPDEAPAPAPQPEKSVAPADTQPMHIDAALEALKKQLQNKEKSTADEQEDD